MEDRSSPRQAHLRYTHIDFFKGRLLARIFLSDPPDSFRFSCFTMSGAIPFSISISGLQRTTSSFHQPISVLVFRRQEFSSSPDLVVTLENSTRDCAKRTKIGSVETKISPDSTILCDNWMVTPSLPQRGWQPKGVTPLTPASLKVLNKKISGSFVFFCDRDPGFSCINQINRFCPARARRGARATPEGGGDAHKISMR